MFTGNKYVSTFVLSFLATILFLSHPGAQDVSEISPFNKQQDEIIQEKVSLEKQPQITIDVPNHDVGELYEGKSIFHSFTVRNTGTADLMIKNVKAG